MVVASQGSGPAPKQRPKASAFKWLCLPLATALACTPPSTNGADDTDFAELEVQGSIFKGPFRAGSAISFTPFTDTLAPNGDALTAEVQADDGSYSADVSIGGLVLAEARGLALDEARGEDGPAEITLGAYAIAGDGALQLQVNVLTDVVRPRVQTLIGEGQAPVAAIAQAEDELTQALPIGVGGRPGMRGTELDPYGEGYAQAWLFAVSSTLAQAAADREVLDGGSLGILMSDLRVDLADDGLLRPPLSRAIYLAEEHMDPDLATLGLTRTLDAAGTGRVVPDLHAALDTDHDGRGNRQDNCRYVANPEQTDTLGKGFGDACDDRLRSVSVNDTWGCGVRVADGRPVCWDVRGLPTGGTPPAPDVFPAHVATPWDGEEKMAGAYVAISVGQRVTCALQQDGEARCDVDGVPEELVLSGRFSQVVASRGSICGLELDGAVSCFDSAGALQVRDPGEHIDVDVFSDGGICVLGADGDLSWMSQPAAPPLPALPVGSYRALDASEEGAGCAIAEADGSLTCFGNPAIVAGAPSGSFAEVAVGRGVACASTSEGTLSCWRDVRICPDVEDGPTKLTALAAGGCQVCGLDELGMGRCWPRRWFESP